MVVVVVVVAVIAASLPTASAASEPILDSISSIPLQFIDPTHEVLGRHEDSQNSFEVGRLHVGNA